MQKRILTVCLCCFLVKLSAQSSIDVLHYKFKIELNDQDDTIKGTTEIRFVLTGWKGSVSFDLAGTKGKSKGMTATNAFLISSSSKSSFYQSNDEITITSSADFKKGDTLNAVICYKGIPSDGLIISKNEYGDRTFFADNWPNRAHNWIPCIDDPDDKASFEFTVTAPQHYRVISNGVETEEKNIGKGMRLTHWKEDVPLSTKVMVIGAANFAVKGFADSPPGIPVSAWVFQQDSTTGFRNYSVAPEILKFFTNYIGPYPFNKLANVQSKTIFGGMENASCIFYEETTASFSQTVESLLAHEIAHQWFGDMASEKSFAHLWLSEGFATYLTHIYIESKYGTDSMDHELQNDRQQVINFANRCNRPVVDSVSPLMNLLNANSYQKGSWVLHMLRCESGDSIFHEIIRAYYEKYKGGNADTRDFEAVAKEVSKKSLNNFFDQWLYKPCIPDLKITWQYLENEKKISLTVEQEQKAEIFQFPLNIKIITSPDQAAVRKIEVSQKKQTFVLPVSSKPVLVVADPFTALLFEGEINEIK